MTEIREKLKATFEVALLVAIVFLIGFPWIVGVDCILKGSMRG
ncbi:MAG: hypothetical protein ABL951_02705 [Alphaproteobacteria bacterium]